MHQFTHDWFSNSIPAWEILIDTSQPKKILEIGSYEGMSACYLIEKCSQYAPISMYCVDTWAGGIEHQELPELQTIEQTFHKNIDHSIKKAANPVVFYKRKGASIVELSKLVAEGHTDFDFIYIDGSHMAADVIADAVLAFKLLKVGGIIIFDDYMWKLKEEMTDDQRRELFYSVDHPRLAIDGFVGIYKNKMEIIRFHNDQNPEQFYETYQFYMKKIAE